MEEQEHDCHICMESKRCISPCRETGHYVCEECWRDWSGTRPEMLVSCPACRQTCFKDPLSQCDSFRILRDHFEWEDYRHDDPPVEIFRSLHGGSIYAAFDAFRAYLTTHPDLSMPMMMRTVSVQFFQLGNPGIRYELEPYIIDFARNPPDMNIMAYYEMIEGAGEDGSTEIISSIDTGELDEMHEYDVQGDYLEEREGEDYVPEFDGDDFDLDYRQEDEMIANMNMHGHGFH